MQVLVVQDCGAGGCLSEERVGGAGLAVFRDGALVQERARSRWLNASSGQLIFIRVLGSDLLADLFLEGTQVALPVPDLVDELCPLALHRRHRRLNWVELVEHGAQLGENIQSLPRCMTALDG